MKDQDDFEDFDAGPVAEERDISEDKPSLAEAWKTNPLLKVGAVILGGAVLYAAYGMIFTKTEEIDNKSIVSAGNIDGAKIVPGQETTDKLYSDAVVEKNQKAAAEAAETGGSAIPIPVATATSEGVDIPEAPAQAEDDPLAEWRARREEAAVAEPEPESPLPVAAAPALPEAAPAPLAQPLPAPTQQQYQPSGPVVSQEMVQRQEEQMRAILGAQLPYEPMQATVTNVTSAYVYQRGEEEALMARRKEQLAMTGRTDISMSEAGVANAGVDSAGGGAAYGSIPTSATGNGFDLTGGGSEVARGKMIVPAGTIAYAQLLNNLNSDVQGPALAQVMSGPLAGGRAIGSFEMKGEYLVLTFKRVMKDGVRYKIDAIALDENTTLAAHQSDVEKHYFSRIILPAAAKFVEGYAGAVAERGTSTTVTAGGGAVQEQSQYSPKESLYKGLEEAGSKAGEVLEKDTNRPITVTVNKGVTMGLLFNESVTTTSVE